MEKIHKKAMAERHAGGFSLVEVTVVILILLVMMAMAILQIRNLLPVMRANSAMDQVLGLMRSARETSIAQRRNIQILFTAPNQIEVRRLNRPTGFTTLSLSNLEGGANFVVFPGVPDTPSGFGNAGPIEFGGIIGGPPIMMFQSDGTFANNVGQPLNGTIFLGIPNNPGTARAVTILGATGRVRPYHWGGTQWNE